MIFMPILYSYINCYFSGPAWIPILIVGWLIAFPFIVIVVFVLCCLFDICALIGILGELCECDN